MPIRILSSPCMGCLSLQGVPATLCASIILINPIAKLALTMEPVAAAATTAVTSRTKGKEASQRQLKLKPYELVALDYCFALDLAHRLGLALWWSQFQSSLQQRYRLFKIASLEFL